MQKHCQSPRDRAPYPQLRPKPPQPAPEPAGELSRLINAELVRRRLAARQRRKEGRRG
jgi:hypothetical protein